MSIAFQTSPLYTEIEPMNPVWISINDMKVPLRFPLEIDSAKEKLVLSDMSFLRRFGLKGPGAAEWLRDQGVNPPNQINHWDEIENDGIVARLATSEFLVEDGFHGATSTRLEAALGHGIPGVSPVFRQDASIIISGHDVNSLLVQTCNVNFNGFGIDERQLVMTSMVGVSVLVIRKLNKGVPLYRIWCDGTFGAYLWKTLLQISEELGGSAIGLDSLFPNLTKLK